MKDIDSDRVSVLSSQVYSTMPRAKAKKKKNKQQPPQPPTVASAMSEQDAAPEFTCDCQSREAPNLGKSEQDVKSQQVPVQPTSAKKVYRNEESREQCLAEVLRFYKSQQHTDVVLKVGHRKFPCHRVILAAASEYFNTMFSSDLKGKSSPDVEMRGTDAETLSSILDYIYSAEIEITKENVQKIVKAAVQYRLTQLVEVCEDFLVSQNCSANCIGFQKFAKLYRLDKLHMVARSTMLKEFSEVIRCHEFCEMTEVELVDYIADSHLEEQVEDVVFRAVQTWVDINPNKRTEAFPRIAQYIRFPHCTKEFLVKEVHMHPLMFDTECQKYFNEAFTFQILPEKQHRITKLRSEPRYKTSGKYVRNCLFLLGGTKLRSKQSSASLWSQDYHEVFKLKSDMKTWEVVTSLPANLRDRTGFSAEAVWEGIIITGGRRGDMALKDCWLFDRQKKLWKPHSEMISPRSGHGSVVHSEYVYVFGGHDHSYLTSAEMYNQETDQWTSLPEMPKALLNVFPISYKEHIYVFCGSDGNHSVNTFAYNTNEKRWVQLEDMPVAGRIKFGSAGLIGDKVYIVGGWDNGCMSYDLQHDTWKRLTPPSSGHHDGDVVVWEGTFFLTGGRQHGTDVTSLVEEYDPEEDEWRESQSLQLPMELYNHQILIGFT